MRRTESESLLERWRLERCPLPGRWPGRMRLPQPPSSAGNSGPAVGAAAAVAAVSGTARQTAACRRSAAGESAWPGVLGAVP